MHKYRANGLLVVLLGGLLLTFSALLYAETSNRIADVFKTSKGELRITPLYHGSVMLEFGGTVIDVDPWSRGDYRDSRRRT